VRIVVFEVFPGSWSVGIAVASMGAKSGIPIRQTGCWSGSAMKSIGGMATGRRILPSGRPREH